MEAAHLKELRKKQQIYQNILFVIYFLLFLGLLYTQVSSLIVFITLGSILILSGLMVFITKSTNFFLRLFPNMKELHQYELNKLGAARKKYYTPNMVLPIVAAVVLLVQALFRSSQEPLINQIPIWYFLIVFLVLVYTANMSLRIHVRRIDTQTEESLTEYANDKMLFTIILSVVVLLFAILGAAYMSLFS